MAELDVLAVCIETVKADVTEIKNDIKELNKKIDAWQNDMEKKFVTRKEFEPVRNIVYGLISAVGLAVIGGLMALLLR
jgi:predicted  nucleic acid-binding Zn-ribbon protein